VSSPGLSDYETSLKFLYVKSIISRLVELRDVTQISLCQEYHLPACRITRRHSSLFITRISFPGLSEDEMSRISFPSLSEDGMSSIFPRFVGLRKVKSVIPRFIERRNVNNIILRFIGRWNVKHLSPFCRITESQKCHSPIYRKTECQ